MGRVRCCELRRSRGCGGRCHDRRSHRGRSIAVFPEGAGAEVGEESCSSRRGRVRDPGVGRRAGCNGSGGRRRRPDTAHIRRSERPVSSSSVIRREMNSAWFCENDAPGPCVALCPRTHLPRLARGSNCRPQSEYPLAAVSPRTPSPPSARGSTGRRQPDDALAAASPRIHTRTSSSTC